MECSLSRLLPLLILVTFWLSAGVDANWRCHECIDSVTIHVQLARDRYSGSDNEGPSHFVKFTYLCTPKPNAGVPRNRSMVDTGAQVPAASAVTDSTLNRVASQPNVVYVAYRSATHRVLMNGWMERGQTSTYTRQISESVELMCGSCVTPRQLGTAFATAGNRDGIQIKTMTVVANLKKKKPEDKGVSVLLLLDRHFKNGWLDTNDYPRVANRKIRLTKAGC